MNICKNRYAHSKLLLLSSSRNVKGFQTRDALYSRHLRLHAQYVTALLQLYERHCPGYCVLLTLVSIEQDLLRLFNWSEEFWDDEICLGISPIVHPRRWDPDEPELTRIWLESRVHPLLASILAPRVPQICKETAMSCLCYLQSGGHSVKTRKSLKPLLKPNYFAGLKMRPCLSCFRRRRHRHSSGHCGLGEGRLRSAWWGNHPERPCDYKNRIQVPFRFFSYRSEYTSDYDIWYTYRVALRLLPVLLAEAPPDSQLASIASDCIFNSFCTAYPQETRKAKKSITQYLHRCRPIRAMPLGRRMTVDNMDAMDVD